MQRFFTRLAIGCLAVLVAAVLGAATGKEAPEKTTIDDCVGKRAAVVFPHAAHAKSHECKTCHHTQEKLTAESTEVVEPCGKCHVKPEKAETPVCSEMSAAKNPFHMSCVKCHKEELAKKPDTKAPTKCDQCHPKA